MAMCRASLLFLLAFLSLGVYGLLTNQWTFQKYTHRQPYHHIQSTLPSRRLLTLHSTTFLRVNQDQDDVILDDFNQIIEAIQIFRDLYGDSNIQQKFEVPACAPWPMRLHGLRLGKRLDKLLSSPAFFNHYPEEVNALKAAGYNPKQEIMDDWVTFISALKFYKEVYGDVRVPSKFVIPDSDPWPRLTRGVKLGTRVAAIRSAGRYIRDKPERKAELDKLGFEWRIRENTHKQQVDDDNFEMVCDALRWYKRLEEPTLNVPENFLVPSKSPWPENLHGLALGSMVTSIINEDKFLFSHPERRDVLAEIGLTWEDNSNRLALSNRRFELVYSALKVYKNIYGNLQVPSAFVVPSTSPWPEVTHGMKLGMRVQSIRVQGTFVTSSPERRFVFIYYTLYV
jgi:hypothetical protein